MNIMIVMNEYNKSNEYHSNNIMLIDFYRKKYA